MARGMEDGAAVVVTGASTGIGRGIAKVLVGKGFRVFGSVRREVDGANLSHELGAGFSPLLFDVTDEAQIAAAADTVKRTLAGRRLWGLVNNAGIANGGPLLYQPEEEIRQTFDVNVFGQLKVIRAFAPLLGTDQSLSGPPGRIVNMSSVGGRIGSPFLGAYSASKHALEGLSEALRRELLVFGIDVILIGPGAINTPIWDKAEQQGYARYENGVYGEAAKRLTTFMVASGKKGFPPEKVGSVVFQALSARHPRVRYAVVPNYWSGWWLPTHLPKRRIDRIFGKNLGLLGRERIPEAR